MIAEIITPQDKELSLSCISICPVSLISCDFFQINLCDNCFSAKENMLASRRKILVLGDLPFKEAE